MYKITTYNKIANVGLDFFDKNKYELSPENLENADGIVLRSYKLHETVFPKSVKAIARAGAGVNNVPVDTCSENGIVVFNAPGANANGVKELTLLGLLLSSRKVVQGIEWVETLDENIEKQVESGKSQFEGPEIKGKTLGVIGLGAIGVLVANMGIKLEMNVIGYDPYISVQKAIGLSWDVDYMSSVDNVISKADYISIHIPLTDSTKDFINKEKITQMKNGVKIINMSRGGLVNDDDMIEALNSGKVGTYVTDFPNDKIAKAKNVISIPHLGASTPESEDNCAIMVVNQLISYLEDGNISNSVNFPDCYLERTENTDRITVLHKNIPNMISSITSMLSKHCVNIEEMVNKSKGNYAYSIIDAQSKIDLNIIDEISKISGVIRVNHI